MKATQTPKAVPPETVNFVKGETYYVKLRDNPDIEPLVCVMDEKTKGSYQGTTWAVKNSHVKSSTWAPGGYVGRVFLDTEIEFVVTGVPPEELHEAYRHKVFAKNK